MLKFRLYYDKDKETLWLNEMAAKGYAMRSFFAGFFTFEKCQPGEYTYQVDFSDKIGVSKDYREFMEETGAEIVQSWFFWVILRKKTADGPFELYTDVDSQSAHYTKIRTMFKAAAIIEFSFFVIEAICQSQVQESTFFLFMVLLALLAAVLANAAIKTNKLIAELKERKGETVPARRNVPPLLLTGLLLNSCTLLTDVSEPFKLPVQIAALIFMLIGIYQAAVKK